MSNRARIGREQAPSPAGTPENSPPVHWRVKQTKATPPVRRPEPPPLGVCAESEGARNAENSDYKTLFPKIKKPQIQSIPIRRLNLNDEKEAAQHASLVKLTNSMVCLNAEFELARTDQERISIRRQLGAVDLDIDRMIYELYDLAHQEIAMIKGVVGVEN